MGVEPTTYTMRTYRSSQLSYYPVYFCDVLNIQLSRKNANQKSRKIEKIRISQEEWHLCGSKARKNPGKRSGAGGGSRTQNFMPDNAVDIHFANVIKHSFPPLQIHPNSSKSGGGRFWIRRADARS